MLRVATWNIHRGRGPAGWFAPARIAAVIAELGADLVALQEAQHYLARSRDMLDFGALHRATGLRPMPVDAAPDHAGWRGNVLLAREDARILRGPLGLRLGGMEPRGGILAELELRGVALRVVCCHLSLGAGRRRAQAAALLAAMRDGAGASLPTLLLGDLNEWRVAGSALDVLSPAFGPGCRLPTFPSFRPALPLDHILCDRGGLLQRVAVHDTPLARRASDHLPLVGQLGPAPL